VETGIGPVQAGRSPASTRNLFLLRTSSSAKMLISFRVQDRIHIEDWRVCLCRQAALVEKTALHA
jgi:hypothetical protein